MNYGSQFLLSVLLGNVVSPDIILCCILNGVKAYGTYRVPTKKPLHLPGQGLGHWSGLCYRLCLRLKLEENLSDRLIFQVHKETSEEKRMKFSHSGYCYAECALAGDLLSTKYSGGNCVLQGFQMQITAHATGSQMRWTVNRCPICHGTCAPGQPVDRPRIWDCG